MHILLDDFGWKTSTNVVSLVVFLGHWGRTGDATPWVEKWVLKNPWALCLIFFGRHHPSLLFPCFSTSFFSVHQFLTSFQPKSPISTDLTHVFRAFQHLFSCLFDPTNPDHPPQTDWNGPHLAGASAAPRPPAASSWGPPARHRKTSASHPRNGCYMLLHDSCMVGVCFAYGLCIVDIFSCEIRLVFLAFLLHSLVCWSLPCNDGVENMCKWSHHS